MKHAFISLRIRLKSVHDSLIYVRLKSNCTWFLFIENGIYRNFFTKHLILLRNFQIGDFLSDIKICDFSKKKIRSTPSRFFCRVITYFPTTITNTSWCLVENKKKLNIIGGSILYHSQITTRRYHKTNRNSVAPLYAHKPCSSRTVIVLFCKFFFEIIVLIRYLIPMKPFASNVSSLRWQSLRCVQITSKRIVVVWK